MKREIKFRGKRTDNGEWVYGNLIKESEDCCISTDDIGIELDDDYWANSYGYPPSSSDFHITNIHEVIPKTVGQFTGLKDKNGVKIFEGDILKMHQFLFDGNEYEKETIGVIKWGEYGWLLSQIDGKEVNEYMGYKNGEGETYLIHFYGSHEESFEIIGNIHDKAQQKQALIDMMRGDEELGLYDDNHKKSRI